MRTAISPRFATSTFEKKATARILPIHGPRRPAHARSRRRGVTRGRALRLALRRPRLVGNRSLHRSDDDRLVRLAGGAQAWAAFAARLTARSRRRQAARPDRAD